MIVTKDTLIGALLANDINTAKYLFEMGMHCVGCPASAMESLEEACNVHGADVNELVAQLNAYFKAQA